MPWGRVLLRPIMMKFLEVLLVTDSRCICIGRNVVSSQLQCFLFDSLVPRWGSICSAIYRNEVAADNVERMWRQSSGIFNHAYNILGTLVTVKQ